MTEDEQSVTNANRLKLQAQLVELMGAMPFGHAVRVKVLRSMWAQKGGAREEKRYQDAGIGSADQLVALYEEGLQKGTMS